MQRFPAADDNVANIDRPPTWGIFDSNVEEVGEVHIMLERGRRARVTKEIVHI